VEVAVEMGGDILSTWIRAMDAIRSLMDQYAEFRRITVVADSEQQIVSCALMDSKKVRSEARWKNRSRFFCHNNNHYAKQTTLSLVLSFQSLSDVSDHELKN